MSTTKPVTKDGLEDAINTLLVEMAGYRGDDAEYSRMADQLVKLYNLKEVDQKIKSRKGVSAETLAVVGGNLLGILMIVGHERAHVVTSKALTMLTKIK